MPVLHGFLDNLFIKIGKWKLSISKQQKNSTFFQKNHAFLTDQHLPVTQVGKSQSSSSVIG